MHYFIQGIRAFTRLLRNRMAQATLIAGAFGAPATVLAQTVTLRVDSTSTATTPNGSTWASAYAKLQDALTAARASADEETPYEVWVRGATGSGLTYYPDLGTGITNDDREASFEMIPWVKVFGEYIGGTGGSADTRNPAYITVLSGEINTAGFSDNSYHVVVADDSAITDTNCRLDGFTIRDGNGDGNGANAGGGGVKVSGGAGPRFDRCIITANLAGGSEDPPSEGFPSSYGAGVQSVNSAPVFTRCTISSNASTSSSGAAYGGGVAVQGERPWVPLEDGCDECFAGIGC